MSSLRTNLDADLIGVWQESERVGVEGESFGPKDPLLIGFFSDGTFKAVFSSHRFETYHDFWGEWETSEETIKLTITGGNQLPAASLYEGQYTIHEQELKLDGIPLLDGTEGQALWFKYQGSAPKDRIIP